MAAALSEFDPLRFDKLSANGVFSVRPELFEGRTAHRGNSG
jgi:hypothetical protein